MTGPVWIFDSAALFRTKTAVAADRQWALFELMKAMVESGSIAFPRQVLSEAQNVTHHDGPEIWLLNVRHSLQHPLDCTIDNHVEVMRRVGSRLIDVDAEGEPADPYVLALALDLRTADRDVAVVTDDHVDHHPMISLRTACREFGVRAYTLDEFLDLINWA